MFTSLLAGVTVARTAKSRTESAALYARLDRGDRDHVAAARQFEALDGTALLTHNDVVVEATALVQSRLGGAVARELHGELLPVVDVTWVGRLTHAAAVAALRPGAARKVSLVDRVSFEVMRLLGLRDAFCLR